MSTKLYIVLVVIAALSTGCRLIDDDLSVCGKDYDLHYEMKLVTEVEAVIEEKLSADVDATLAQELREWLDPIFSGFAHDLNMYFYEADSTEELRHTWHEIVDAKHASYTLYIPRQDYQHIAVVNIEDNPDITFSGDSYSSTMVIDQIHQDTLPTYRESIYTARMQMLMSDTTVSSFHVHLYTTTSAVALILDTVSSNIADLTVLLSGTASKFEVRDSIFSFTYPSLIRAQRVNNRCYAVASMPSRDVAPTPPAGMPAKTNTASIWQLKAYARLYNGTVTETILDISTPLKAGTLEIIRVKELADGSLIPVQESGVGASVTLDWSDGGSHEIEL